MSSSGGFISNFVGSKWATVAAVALLATGAVVAPSVTGGSGAQSCPALPAFPDASCTGVPSGTSLTTHSGDQTITTNNTTIDGWNTGCVDVNANNVTIKNSKITCSEGGIFIEPGKTGLAIQDTEVDCTGTGGTAIGPQDYTMLRIDSDGCENGAWAEHNVTIRDSYIHHLIDYDPVHDPHTDGVQIPSSATNLTIDHNRIYGNYVDPSSFGSSALTTASGMSNVSITSNLFAGGGYALRCQGAAGSTTFVVTGNRFSTIFVSTVGGFGAADGFCIGAATTYSDNVFYDGPDVGDPVE